MKEQRLARIPEAKKPDKNYELRLYSYIDKYYGPYARAHSVSCKEIVRILKREFEFIKNKPIDKICSQDIEQWRSVRGEQVTFARLKLIYTYLKACINTAFKYYKLSDRFELQRYTLKRKLNERVNPPKIRYLSKDEEARRLQALAARDDELRAMRARYIEWQSKRNHGKRRQQPFADRDYPDHITPIITLAYHTGFNIGDIFTCTGSMWISQTIRFAKSATKPNIRRITHNLWSCQCRQRSPRYYGSGVSNTA